MTKWAVGSLCYKLVNCQRLLSAKSAVILTTAEHDCGLIVTELYCLVTEAHLLNSYLLLHETGSRTASSWAVRRV